MIREIHRLQQKNEHLETEKDTLGEKIGYIEHIIGSLKNDNQGSEIIRRLKSGESHKAIAEWLGRPLLGSVDAPSLSPTTEFSINEAIEQYHQRLAEDCDPRYWTSVTQDAELIEHLVALYFTWMNPIHMIIDEIQFIDSFQRCSEVYCSSALVTIICAMSCFLLHHIDNDDSQMKAAVDSLRDRFIKETQSLMREVDDHRMTTIQVHAIMYLVEFASGHGLIATSHLRLAVEKLMEKQELEQARNSELVTNLGIMSLHM